MFRPEGFTFQFENSIFHGNSGHGIEFINGSMGSIVNCIFTSNGGYGINVTNAMSNMLIWRSAFFGNTSGGVSPSVDASNIRECVTLTANPFVNAAAGDFALNATVGGGAACKAAGYPGTLPGGTAIGYVDIGAVQSQGGGASGPRLPTGQIGRGR